MRKQVGLTLIELMVVVAVLAILSAIAYPLYTDQVQKSRRTEARVVLNELALAQNRYFTVNGSYATQVQLGTVYNDALDKMTDRNGDGTPDYYTINLVRPTATTFDITATATGPQEADDDCATLSIDELGARTATGDAPGKCW